LERPDEPSPTRSGVLTRLSHSHIRFGTFQRHAYFDRADNIERMIDHVIETYYPALAGVDGVAARAPALLAEVVEAAAHLAARWMAAGFVHGVLNTDNMNITGESFDYGPYRFLPRNDPNFIAAYFDQNGLYSFGRQPEAVLWNLQQLAGALSVVSETEPLARALNGFSPAYRDALRAAMLNRLGLRARDAEADVALVNLAFRALAEAGEGVRWEPFFFDWFGGAASEDRALGGSRAGLYGGEQALAFRAALRDFEPEGPARLAGAYFAGAEPEELLYDQIEALWAPIAERDDWSAFNGKLSAIEQARIAWGLDSAGGTWPSRGLTLI
ncbi:MAG TPA: protein adenylyltransferase SelO family protein, partial [Caulobacteraceae bacterium]|nr:protein adenylyltransferase SelO family protein [Caulobacteraceae bacterium]